MTGDDKGLKSAYELEILHQGQMRALIDPAERDARDAEYRRERERCSTERDARIEKARAPAHPRVSG